MSHFDPAHSDSAKQSALRALPSVDQLLGHHAIAPLMHDYPRGEVIAAIRAALDVRRRGILAGDARLLASADAGPASFGLDVRAELQRRSQPNLRRVVNATGIVLHTGLGRAPLSQEAVNAIVEIAGGYCNLELDLQTGSRGDRHESVRALLCELTGGEDAIVVNNNAAATVLALAALAAGREVIVSRGQLVEIGGSYRMPDIMAASGCRMVEVGTTNRTRIADYSNRITPDTAALLSVHTSNYRIRGFVESAELNELVGLAAAHGLIVIDDLGSGLLDRSNEMSPAARGVSAIHAFTDDGDFAVLRGGESDIAWDEPTVRASVAAGASMTLFSGDKLLGGPQAGIIVGRRELIAQCRSHPLMRAFRPDKLTFAALEATLRLYRDPALAMQRIPALRMLHTPLSELEDQAEQLADLIRAHTPAATVRVESGASMAGGGSLPITNFPTCVVAVSLGDTAAGDVAAALRRAENPVICRVRDAAMYFDPRTINPEDYMLIATAIAEVARELSFESTR